jgi:hypothetical protein
MALVWRGFRFAAAMDRNRTPAQMLRAEASVLTLAGVLLLAVGFPFTLMLVAMALASETFSPMLPIAAGAPPIMLGYLACHFAARRLEKARTLDGLAADRQNG